MLPEVASLLLGLALAATLYAAFAAYWGLRRHDRRFAESSRNAIYAATALLGATLLGLLVAFLDDQFQVEYVASHSSIALPAYFKVSAIWAGQEGSLLLWAFLQSLLAAMIIFRPTDRTRALLPWASVILSLVTAFFVAVTLFLSNPFELLPTTPADGQGLNPLLRHPGMIFHPPALYFGYVGLAVPFAFGLSALLIRKIDGWPSAARRWTLGAWFFLGLGLLLGARWAYDVLGWGGYWAWDPVENAGLLPWLTATALVHTAVMQDQRRGFRAWNLIFAVFSFALVLFGTFVTRSGLIQSVHAFSRSNLGPYFLAAIGITLVGSLALIYSRRDLLASPQDSQGLLSRDGTFYLTVLLFLTLTVSVLVGSLLPTLTEVLSGQRYEAGPEWFDRVTGPQFAALALVMGFCPLLGRSASSLQRLRTRGIPGVVGALLVVTSALIAGFTRPIPLIGFAVIGLAMGTTLAEYARASMALSKSRGEKILQAFLLLFGQNRRRYGGYLVHVGVILMALGIIGTRMYPIETEAVLSSGESVEIGKYTLTYQDLQQEAVEDQTNSWANVTVYENGEYLTTLRPKMEQYSRSDQNASLPALRSNLREDLYIVLAGWSRGGATATFKVFVNPLASFLWLGGLVFLAGSVVGLWSAPTVERTPLAGGRRRTIGTTVAIAVGTLVFVAAGLAMWGTGLAGGRVRLGQSAPGFSLTLLDGSRLTMSELQGRVSVINFWATWCPPCEDEMPDLQATWAKYEAQGVMFVGVSIDTTDEPVREMLSRFGTTYPVGLDSAGRISIAYGISAVPETFVVDQQGRVAYIHLGQVGAEQLGKEIETLLSR